MINSKNQIHGYITECGPSILDYKIHEAKTVAKLLEHFVSKNSYLMQFYEINICQVIILRLYTVYNKHEMIKIGKQTREKSQILSQGLK